MGYIKSEKSYIPIIPIINDSSNHQPTYLTYSTNNKSDAKTVSYESFSFIDTKDAPWIILPPSVILRIGVQETTEIAGYLDIFTTTPLSLLENQASIQKLKKIIPEFLSGWLLHV
jgi:hypothetical protein